MKTIVISNRKGGTGKTTTAYNLGYAYAIKGKSVLFIDLDSQGNLSFLCGQERSDLQSFKDCKIHQVNQLIDILPATAQFSQLEHEINGMIDRNVFIKNDLFPKLNRYDYCIIDTSPSLGILNVNAWCVADMVHIVVNADAFSLTGLMEMKGILDQVKSINNRMQYGIVLNDYYTGQTMTDGAIGALKEFPEYTGINIPNRAYVTKSNAARKPAIDHEEIGSVFSQLVEVL